MIRWAILFLVLGVALVVTADPISGGNFIVAGYVALVVSVVFGIRWATTSGFFDDGHDTGRTK